MLKIFEVNSNIVFIGTQKNKKKNKNVTNKCKWTIFLTHVVHHSFWNMA